MTLLNSRMATGLSFSLHTLDHKHVYTLWEWKSTSILLRLLPLNFLCKVKYFLSFIFCAEKKSETVVQGTQKSALAIGSRSSYASLPVFVTEYCYAES